MAESGWIRGAGPPGRRWVPLSALSWLVSAALREVEGERQLGGRRPRWQRGCQRRRKPEVPENAADHLRIVDRGDQAEAATAGPASENVKLEHPAQKVGPLEPPTGFPRFGRSSFGSWLRTIRPGIPPSEMVAVLALRNTLPHFLLAGQPTSALAIFIAERTDTSRSEGFRLTG